MRWWLAAVFVAIATLTAVLIAAVSSRQADRELRANAENIALGAGISARSAVEQAIIDGNLRSQLPSIGARHNVALFVFSAKQRLMAQGHFKDVRWQDVPDGAAAVLTALAEGRYVAAFHGGRSTLVALPLERRNDAAVLVAYAPKPPYGPSLAIFRHDVVQASIWAVAAAALTGLVAATLIARRLKRIAGSAAAIEQGDFALELEEPGLHDEIGDLALTIDRMRTRLGTAFEQLSAERDRLERVLEQMNEGVLAVDTDLRVEFANTNAKRLLAGVPLDKGSPLPETYDGLPLRRVAEGLFVPRASVAEARSQREDGATISLVGVPASSSDLVVLVFADITEQERRRQAEREFVTNASHELRTPVTAITSAVEALQSGAKDDPERRERFIDLIGRQAARLTRLSSSLLILARAQTRQENLHLEPVELGGLLNEIAAGSVPAEGVGLRVDCPRPVVAVGQRDIVEQVVANLVGNALKHTVEGEIVLRATQDGAKARVEVVDTGPGIAPTVQGRVFDRFYSAEVNGREGFGLGLAIARESAEAIGGALTIESETGAGTTARLELPAARRG
jgi:signal transduction histidine kinase